MRGIGYLASCLALAAFVGTGIAAAGVAEAGEMVVLKSTSAALKEGSVIDGAQPLKLDAGASVTLIGADGSMVRLRGPYNGTPAQAPLRGAGKPGIVKALGAILSERKVSTASLGVLRSTGGSGGPLADPWMVNVDGSGTRCIRRDIVVLWRGDATRDQRLTITRTKIGMTTQAQWAAGDRVLPVSGRKFKDSARYTVERGGRRVDLTMRVMPGELTGVAEQAAWMAGVGCKQQALALLDTIL